MDLEQVVEFSARALYDGWRTLENQHRREVRASSPIHHRRGRAVLPRIPADVPEWEAVGRHEQEVYRTRVRPVVRALFRADLLKVGAARMYDVVIDDPDLAREYRFEEVKAFSAQAAAIEGARRACRQDPLRFLHATPGAATPFPGYPLPYSDDARAYESPQLIDAVAMYAQVREAGVEDGWVDRETLWGGY